jgi:hypothetical protein
MNRLTALRRGLLFVVFATMPAGLRGADKSASPLVVAELGNRVETATQILEQEARRFDQQVATELGPVLQVELGFMKRICAPTSEQMGHLEQNRPQQLASVARVLRDRQFLFTDSRHASMGRQVVQHEIASWVRSHVSAAHSATYQDEIEKRDANLREVCVRNIVVGLDRELRLSSAQRERLCASLAGKWNESWIASAVVTATTLQGPFLALPDELVVPTLNPTQRAHWNSLLKGGRFDWDMQSALFLGLDPPEIPLAFVAAFVAGADIRFLSNRNGDDPLRVMPAVRLETAGEQSAIDPTSIDRWVYVSLPLGGREWLDDSLELKIEEIANACALSEVQLQKLKLAGQGDIRAFGRRVEGLKAKLEAGPIPRKEVAEVFRDAAQLREAIQQGLFESGSLVHKTLPMTLRPDQRANYEELDRERRTYQHRARVEMFVAQLDSVAGLSDVQRRRLARFILENTSRPHCSSQLEYSVVLVQLSRLSDDMLKPLFDSRQWRLLERELAKAKKLVAVLSQYGVIPEGGPQTVSKP